MASNAKKTQTTENGTTNTAMGMDTTSRGNERRLAVVDIRFFQSQTSPTTHRDEYIRTCREQAVKSLSQYELPGTFKLVS